jgi:membrane-anchored mycosin MYCP
MTRSLRARTTRATAVAASALLVVLGPAGVPAFADQPATSTAQPGPSAWEPPPVDMAALDSLPAENPAGTPDDPTFALGQNGGCIQSGVGKVQLTDRPAAQDMLAIDQAQQFSTGKGVTVAVIDTGVNPHPFLASGGRLRNGGDYILGDGNALSDCDGHGTIVAGIIAADTRHQPDIAFTGVAPDADILAIKHTSTHFTAQDDDNRTAGDLQTLAEAIRFAADQSSVKVITMSVDDCMLASSEQATLASQSAMQLQAAIHYAVNDRDKVVIAAAGNLPSGGDGKTDQNGQQAGACQNAKQNDDPNPNLLNQVQAPPVYADDVMSVASVDPLTGAPSQFTVWGPWVTIAAPGEQITSLDPGPGSSGLSNRTTENNQSVALQGTSFAAPYVAGVAALIRSKYPNLSARQVMYRMEATAQHPSGPGGRNNQIGFGIINPVAALTALIPGQNGVPVTASRQIRATLPMGAVKDWTPVRVAVIAAAVALTLLLSTLFVVRTVRRNRQMRQA